MEKRQSTEINLRRTIITAILGYVCLAVFFYVPYVDTDINEYLVAMGATAGSL